MRVLGVDPGGTTGIAIVRYEDGRYSLDVHGGLTGTLEEVTRDLRPFVSNLVPIAAERFVVNRRAGRSRSAHAGEKARNVLGWLLTRGPRVHLATASEAKLWATDKRLAAAGLVCTDGLPHSRDAARHALYTLVKHYRCPDPLGSAYRKGADQWPPDTP